MRKKFEHIHNWIAVHTLLGFRGVRCTACGTYLIPDSLVNYLNMCETNIAMLALLIGNKVDPGE